MKKIFNTNELEAYFLGIVSVAAFAMTLPAAKYLLTDLTSLQIGIYRSFLAALAAIPILLIYKVKLPNRSQLKRLFLTSSGIIYGFPILTAVGMEYVPVSHGGVVLAALPLSTAIFGALISKKNPSKLFWFFAILGFSVVLSYTIYTSDVKELYLGDLALLGAVIFAGLGYAQGGLLSSEMPGWQVMCWTLAINFPFLLLLTFLVFEPSNVELSTISWISLSFLAFINSLLGFFSWNKALALGGVSKISQLQLLQVFFTYGYAVLLMDEQWSWITLFTCVVVVIIVIFSKRA